jgi:hypothetical protein
MKLRSRGLGRRELVMDFREYEIKREGDEVVIVGTIHEPVTWDFTIRIEPRDIPGMLRVGINHHTLGLGARWIFHRKANHAEAATVAGNGSDAAEAAVEAEQQPTAGRAGRPGGLARGISPVPASAAAVGLRRRAG